MSPHQTATKIVAKFLGCPEEQAANGQLTSQICDAIQAASNEELNRRRERVAALEAALTFYSKHEQWIAITRDADCPSTLLIANGRNRKNGHGWEEAEAALSGSTSALTAAIAEAVAKLTEEWDALREKVADYQCKLAMIRVEAKDQIVRTPFVNAVDRIVGLEAFAALAAKYAHFKAEGRKAGLEEAGIAIIRRGYTELGMEIGNLAAQAGEGARG